MTIDLGDDYGREPGQGTVTPGVDLFLSRGTQPDSWSIEAWGDPPYDTVAVDQMRHAIRQVLPEIASTWEEVKPGS